MPEMLENGGLCEGALGPEKPDLERFLLREACRHDLAEQPEHFLVPQRAFIAFLHGPQHFGLPLRTVVVDRGSQLPLGNADLLRVTRTLVDQRLNLPINGVDALTNFAEVERSVRRRRSLLCHDPRPLMACD